MLVNSATSYLTLIKTFSVSGTRSTDEIGIRFSSPSKGFFATSNERAEENGDAKHLDHLAMPFRRQTRSLPRSNPDFVTGKTTISHPSLEEQLIEASSRVHSIVPSNKLLLRISMFH